MKNKISGFLKLLAAAVLLSFAARTSLAANLVEFRDSNNVFAISISTPGNNLVGAGLNASSITAGTIANVYLTSQVTLQSNSFNGSSQLVQTTAGGLLPVLSGANLTSLTAANISAGSLGASVIASSVTQSVFTLITVPVTHTSSVTFNAAVEISSAPLTVDGSGTTGIQLSAGKQIIVGNNLAGGTGTALEIDQANSGANVHVRNSSTGAIVRLTNGTGNVEQGIFADAGNDATAANSTLRLTNGGATKLLWVGNSGLVGLGTESPATTLDVKGNAQFGTGALKSTMTATGEGVFPSSVTASAFFGDGSHLTTITVSAANVTAGTFQNSIYTFPTTTVINGLSLFGALSAATLRTTACSTFVSGSAGCMAYNATDFDMYTSTGSSAGQWRNSRSGIGP